MTTLLTKPRTAILAGSLFLVCGFLGGCATSRMLAAPLPTRVPDLGLAAVAPDGLAFALHQVIVPNGGGSWVRDAHWDEYVLTVRNEGQIPVEIERVEMYSSKFSAPVQGSASQEQLAVQTGRVQQDLKDAGLVGGTTLATAGVAAAAAGTGGGYVSAAAVAAAVAIPIALIGGTSYVVSRRHRAREDKVKIDQLFLERGLGVPAPIAPGTQLNKSVFFPLTPAPTRLVVHYAVNGEARELALDTPVLAGLHLKSAAR